MATRTRRVVTLTALFTTSLTLFLSGATTADANKRPQPVVDTSRAGNIRLEVSSNRSTVGSPGSHRIVGIKPLTTSLPPPCQMVPKRTGQEAYLMFSPFPFTAELYRGLEQHKDDDKGHWYEPFCDFTNWTGQNDIAGRTAFVSDFVDSHPYFYVEENETPPTAPVSPRQLRDIAIANLPLPKPKLDWNPKLIGNQGTLVNLETWFWLADLPPTTATVRATLPDGTNTSVTVTFAGMDIEADSDSVKCADPGTPYTPGAHDPTCVLKFSRASSSVFGRTATPVTVASRWEGTWTHNGESMGDLDPQPSPVKGDPVKITVNEVQTLVTGVR